MRIKTQFLLSALAYSSITGCAVGPDYVQPQIETAATFAGSDLTHATSEQVPLEWWRSFNDETLTGLITEAVAKNRSISGALAAVEESRAARWERTFDLLPTINAGAGYTELQSSTARFGNFGSVAGPNGAPFNTKAKYYSGTFDALWELDFFGRVRRSVEAASAQEEASAAQLADAVRIVIAEVASNYFQLRGLQQQLDVARRNAANQEKTVQLTETLFEGGRVTALDTSRARSQLKSTLATIAPMEHSIRASIHRISVLTGKQPQILVPELSVAKPLPKYSGPLQISNPKELLYRRPDLVASEKRLAAATASIGIATGDYFPKVTFRGSFGYEAQKVSQLGEKTTKAYSFGPSLTWAFLDLGRVYQQVKEADKRAAQALADYEGSVLAILEETENALSLYAANTERREYLREAVHESRTAADLARIQYNDGMVDFLTVLDAERALLAVEDQFAASETSSATALIGIYKALGGGWENLQAEDGQLKRVDVGETDKGVPVPQLVSTRPL